MVAQLLPWSLNGGIVVATVIVQWMLLVGQKRHNGGTRQAEASLKVIHNVNNSTPMADHCPSSLRPQRCRCLPPASFERHVSDPPPRRPLCDCFEHAQNFTATMVSMAKSGRTKEAQRSQPLCKGYIVNLCRLC